MNCYEGYGKQTTHANTPYPAFTVKVRAGQASRPRYPERTGRAFDWWATVDPREVARVIRLALATDAQASAPPG